VIGTAVTSQDRDAARELLTAYRRLATASFANHSTGSWLQGRRDRAL
jgi:hypothetical protein